LVITFDQFGCYRHRVPNVGKAFAADAIDRKLASLRRPHVHTGQIADRVVVFCIAQSTQRYRSRITGPRRRLSIERRRDPTHQSFTLNFGRLRRFHWRHVTITHTLSDIVKQ
jgi:hypothetical protein